MWQTKEFWQDAAWRSLRTFSQTWEGILTAYAAYIAVKVSEALKDPTASVDFGSLIGGWGLWALFLLASLIAAGRSLMQSIDRERAVAKTTTPAASEPYSSYPYSSEPAVDPTPTAPLPTPPDDNQRATSPVFGFIPPTHGCGESLR